MKKQNKTNISTSALTFPAFSSCLASISPTGGAVAHIKNADSSQSLANFSLFLPLRECVRVRVCVWGEFKQVDT